jgi:hypothetical protein
MNGGVLVGILQTDVRVEGCQHHHGRSATPFASPQAFENLISRMVKILKPVGQ